MKTNSLNSLKTIMVLGASMLVTIFTSCNKTNSVNPAITIKAEAFSTRTFNAIPTTISEGLIAYWSCANTAYDLSGNGNNGTLNSVTATSDRLGHNTGAYLFNGTSSYISVPDAVPLRLNNNDFTLNAWVELSGYNSSYGSVMLGKRMTGANNGWTWNIVGSAGSPVGVVSYGPGGGSTNAFGTTAVGLNSWHMVTSLYYSSIQTLKIYVDGVYQNTTAGISAANAAITAQLYIGKDNPSVPDNGYYLNGALNDIRMYNRTISTTEIADLYNATTAPTAELIAYWPLTNTANDLSGNGNNGTLNSVTTTTDRFGNTIGAYLFNGTSSYISVPDAVPLRLNNTDFTLNAWVELSGYNSSYGSVMLGKRMTGANNGWTWNIVGSAGSPVGVVSYGPGGGSTNAFGTTAVGLNSWHMVTSIYSLSSGTLSIYVDGVFQNATSNISTANATITALLYIGKDNPSVPDNGYYLNGALNDIRMYNRAISTTEIADLYNALN